jgi:peptide/nickel transport system permease protein
MTTVATRLTTQVREQEEEFILPEETVSVWALAWRRLRRHKLALLGMGVLTFFITMSLLAPVVAPYEFDAVDLNKSLALPSAEHLFGTDQLGRDILTRLLYAGRISLTVALIATLLATLIGTIIGAVAGYAGGWVDTVLMRLTDVMLTLPLLPMLMIASASLREFVALQRLLGNLLSVFIIISVVTVFGWMSVARLVHGSVLSLREREFMEAARALGASGWLLITKHLIPNSLAPIIVSATLSFGAVVVFEATLSFLGLGVQPPIPSWGNMLNEVQGIMFRNPALAFYPGLCIFFTVLSINFLGDGLRDALDPRLKL